MSNILWSLSLKKERLSWWAEIETYATDSVPSSALVEEWFCREAYVPSSIGLRVLGRVVGRLG